MMLRSLFAKFLLVLIPVFLLLAGAGFAIQLHHDERVAGEALAVRVGNQAARVSAILNKEKATRNPIVAENLLSLLVADRAIICAEIRAAKDGKVLLASARAGACEAQPEQHRLALPIDATTSLQLYFLDGEIAAAAQARHKITLLIIAAALLVSILSAALGYRLIVDGRLRRLREALERIAHKGERVPLEATGKDALSNIMRAFNEMIDREAEREEDLKRSHQALVDEKRFRDFAASASDWYWEMDAQLRFSFFSDTFAEVSGVAPSALLGKTREETGIPNVDLDEWQRHLAALREHRPFRSFTHPRMKSSGEKVWLSISGTPVFDDAGKFQGYRGTGADVTERVEMQQQLIRAKEMSEQAARAKSEFLANMSHEIRTPINGVMGMNEALLRTALTDKQRRFAKTVQRSAETLLRVINDILDFSKIEAGKLELHYAPFDLRELLEDIGELYADSAQRKGVELMCGLPSAAHTAYRGDAGRLRQILTNLVGNAIKFTDRGEVVLSVGESGSGQLKLTVRDTGIGIADEAQARVFESFAQADSSTGRRYGGTGLGLAISAQLARLMGGEMGVTSVLGEGSVFWLEVPLERQAQSSLGEARDALVGRRILMVDDNATNREIYAEQLRAWGVEHACAGSGAEALERLEHAAAEAQPYDLVLLDMDMPEMNGLALAQAISGRSSIGSVRRVMLSSVNQPPTALELAGAGIESSLTKPVRQAELYQGLVSVLSEQAPAAEQSLGVEGRVSSKRHLGRILLAEDSLVNQEVALELIGSLGPEIELVNDGMEAVERWSGGRFDLILMDCQMPHMDGFEATETIRRLEGERSATRTPIVAMTANALKGDRERCLQAGMDDYLSKPFGAQELELILARWLPGNASETVPGDASVHADPIEDSPVVVQAFAPSANAIDRRVLDPQVLQAICGPSARGDAGDPGGKSLFERLADAYLEQSAEHFQQLREAITAQDAAGVGSAAHVLKSSSANVGATGFSQLCLELEMLAQKRNVRDAASRLPEVERLYGDVREALSAATSG